MPLHCNPAILLVDGTIPIDDIISILASQFFNQPHLFQHLLLCYTIDFVICQISPLSIIPSHCRLVCFLTHSVPKPCTKVKVKSLSHVWLFVTPWTVAYQAPWSMEFSRQEYMGCHCLLPEIFPTQGSNPGLPHCRQTLYNQRLNVHVWKFRVVSYSQDFLFQDLRQMKMIAKQWALHYDWCHWSTY